MSPETIARKPVVFLLCLAGVAAGLWLWTFRSSERLQGELADLSRQRKALHVAEQTVHDRLLRLERPLRPAASHLRRPIPGPFNRPAPMFGDTLKNDSKLQALFFSAKRSALPSIYGPLFRTLRLSPEQVGQIEELVIRREEQAFDVASMDPALAHISAVDLFGYDPLAMSAEQIQAEAKKVQGEDPVSASLLQQNADAFRDAAAALLGADGYKAFQQYERALPLQPTMREIAGELAASDPLDSGQAEQLARILAESTPGYGLGAMAQVQSIDWNQALSKTGALLSPAQQAYLKTYAASAEASQNFYDLSMKAAGR